MYLRVDFLDVFLFPEKESYFKKYLKLFFFFFNDVNQNPCTLRRKRNKYLF